MTLTRHRQLGLALGALGRLSRSDLLDRLRLRERAERAVYRLAKSGVGQPSSSRRRFPDSGPVADGAGTDGAATTGGTPPTRHRPTAGEDFDLTPTDEQAALLEVVGEFADEQLRPHAAAADRDQQLPTVVRAAGHQLGLPLLGVPTELDGIADESPVLTGALVAEALGRGDLGLAVALLAPGAVATCLAEWGSTDQQARYLPEFTGADVPLASLALAEPSVRFDALTPATTAVARDDGGYDLIGRKSGVVAGADAELVVVGAQVDGRPALFLVEPASGGVRVTPDPLLGARAAGFAILDLDRARGRLLGTADGSTYTEVLRRSRLAWSALAVGVMQAVLDHVTPYVKTREAFGEPVAHRQAVAFTIADLATELQATRLITWRAASRAARGADYAEDVALARIAVQTHGLQAGLDGVQLLGGHGYVKEHPVERWFRDLRTAGLLEGAVLI